jgi:uncharacterized protein (TIGR00251 family)
LTAKRHSDTVLLRLRVHPNASRNEVNGFTGGILQVRVSAPPVKGKANRELTTFLSQRLGISPSSLTIVKGQLSRNKVIAIDGLSQEDMMRRLST